VTAITANAIQQIKLLQPELATKTGIVSLVEDNGRRARHLQPRRHQHRSDDESVSQRRRRQSVRACRYGNRHGSPYRHRYPSASDDLNVTGADASDTARVVTTVTNNGHATAYDVVLSGALPSGYSTSDVHNFGIYNAAGVQIDTGVTAAQYFATGGVTLPDAAASRANPPFMSSMT